MITWPIAHYPCSTLSLPKARIDLDQQAIVQSLAAGDFDSALKIYQEGAFSKSVSLLTVSSAGGIPVDIVQGSLLEGSNSAGGSVVVKAQGSNHTVGDTSISVQYVDEGCYVGANPDPVTDGCTLQTRYRFRFIEPIHGDSRVVSRSLL